MSRFKIVTRSGEFFAELDDSDVSNAIWLSLPFKPVINMIGGKIYFEMPINPDVEGMERVTDVEKGDVCWWPGPRALCIFYGPTPLSGDDSRPISPHPVIRIGRMDECEGLDDAGDRQRILMDKAF